MSKAIFYVNLSPRNALAQIRDQMTADLVHAEEHTVTDDKEIGTLVFEKYFLRTKNRAALVVIADNLQGMTQIRSIATGSSEGMFFNFDWGAAESFVGEVENILQAYIVSVEEE